MTTERLLGVLGALLMLACSASTTPVKQADVDVSPPTSCDSGGCPVPPREGPRSGHSCDACIDAWTACAQSKACLDAGDCLIAEKTLTAELIQYCELEHPKGMAQIAEMFEACGRFYVITR